MDFLDPDKKKAQRTRLMIGYVLVAVALAMGTWLLVVLSSGYSYDRRTGTVIQNGIVFVDSRPVSADVYVNGERQSSRTNTKLVLPSGQYTVSLQRSGYRNWSRKFPLQGGSIERLDYPLLFPKTFSPAEVDLYARAPAFATQSLDRHWMLVQQPGRILTFDLIDLTSQGASATTLTLPSTLIANPTATNQTWQLVEWSNDNRHVLLRHQFGKAVDFIMVDRQNPASSFNVNQLFGQNPSQVALRNKRFDQLYLYNAAAQILQVGIVNNATVSNFLSHVLAFKAHDDKNILFVSSEATKPNQVPLKLYASGHTYTLRQLPARTNYLLEVARFDGHWYMAASPQSESRTYIYRDPETVLKQENGNNLLLPAIVLTLNKPEFLAVSDNARFISIESGQHFAVYDANSDRRYYYDIPAAQQAGQHATWMDGNRLTLVSANKVVAFDYDGINIQTLVAANAHSQPFFDRSYKWLYTFAPSTTVTGRSALTRSDLLVK